MMKIRHRFLNLNVAASSVGPTMLSKATARNALARGEFFLDYQPIVDLETGSIVAVEALIRWQHPRHDLLSADQFIPLAESSGAIELLGEFVLHEACKTLHRLHDDYPARSDFSMHVNVSAQQLNPDFTAEVRRALKAMPGTDPECL